jgi:hypothetical protein
MEHIHPIISRVLAGILPEVCETSEADDTATKELLALEYEPNDFELEADIGQCPECHSLVLNGVCQGASCKSRLL